MSVIDSKVVKMVFDNAGFESGVKDTMSSLDKLKSKLNFSGAADGLSEVGRVADKLNFSGFSGAVEAVGQKFSALEAIAIGALMKIGAQAVETGERIIKSISIDQVTAGWSKYEDKTAAVQTIMAATKTTWEQNATAIGFTGDQMEFVNSQLDKLNWFTDETSYNFVDMVGNIGKFTSNNIALSDSVTAMQGIANWAAISGQKADAASRAMYNLAQAIGVGSVKLIDWKSIENANMATAEFKQKVIDTAVSMGTLKKVGEQYFTVAKNTAVSVTDFNSALTEGWFSKDVLMGTLSQYGNFTDELFNLADASELTATQILGCIESIKQGVPVNEAMADVLDDSRISAEDLATALESLASEENDFGYNAFKAAQEAKTLSDALDATKDAASTSWMNIFETIFGDYETARHVWTDFANWLYDTFVSPLELIQDVLDDWSGIEGARDRFFDIFRNFTGTIGSYLEPIKNAWNDVFEPLTGTRLNEIITNIADFFAGLKMGDNAANLLQETFSQLFATIKNIGNIFRNLLSVLSPVLEYIRPIGTALLVIFENLTGWISIGITKLQDWLYNSGLLETATQAVQNIMQKLFLIIAKISRNSSGVFEKISGALKKVFSAIFEGIPISEHFNNIWEKIKSIFESISNFFSPIIEKIKGFFSTIKNGLKDFDLFGTIAEKISKIFNTLKTVISKFGEIIHDVFGWIKDNIRTIFVDSLGIGAILGVFKKVFTKKKSIADVIGEFLGGGKGSIADTISGFFEPIKGAFESITGYFQSSKMEKTSKSLLRVAAALGVFALAILALSIVDPKTVGRSLSIMAAGLLEMGAALVALGDVGGPGMVAAAASLLLVSTAMLVFAGALAALSLVSRMDGILGGLALVASGLLIMSASFGVLAKVCPPAGLLAAAAAILIVSAALIVLAGALAAFTLVARMKGVLDGIGAMLLSLTLVWGAVATLSAIGKGNVGGLLASAAAILVVSASLIVLAGALAAFSLVAKMDTVGTGFALLAGSLTVVALALGLLSKFCNPGSLLASAAAMLVMSVAIDLLAVGLTVLALAIAVLAKADPIGLTVALLGMAAMLAVMTAALLILGNAGPIVLAGAAALLVLASAMLVTAAAVAVLAIAMPFVGAGLEALGSGIAALGIGIGNAITGVLNGIGKGVEQFSIHIMNASVTMGSALMIFGQGIEVAIRSIGTGIGGLFEEIGKGIAKGLEAISESLTSMASSISGIGDSIANVGVGIAVLGESVKTLEDISWLSLAAGILDFSHSMKDLNKNPFNGGNVQGMISYTVAIQNLTSIADGFAVSLSKMLATMEDAGRNLVVYMTNGMNSAMGYVTSAASNISYNAYSVASGYTSWFNTLGWNMMIGLVNGIYSGSNEVYRACQVVVSNALSVAFQTAAVNSPSKIMIKLGKGLDEGLVVGVIRDAKDVYKAIRSVVENTISAAKEACNDITEGLESGASPVITPVLDTREALVSAKQLSDSLNSIGTSVTSNSLANRIQQTRVEVQNEKSIQQVVASLDKAAMGVIAAQANKSIEVNNNITFEGSLSQLARVLQPAIVSETNRIGETIIPV